MYNIAEAATKGGLNIVAKRVTEIYDHEKERIIYMDMKNMYVHTIQQPLPSGEYELVDAPTCSYLLELARTIDLDTDGALITLDIAFPAHTHTR